MKRYVDNSPQYYHQMSPLAKLKNQPSLQRLGEPLGRRQQSVEKFANLNTPKRHNKNNPSLSKKMLYRDPPIVDREYRSQSPYRLKKQVVESYSSELRSIKSGGIDLYKTPQGNQSISGISRKKPYIIETHPTMESPRASNKKSALIEQLKSFDEKYALQFFEGYAEKMMLKCVELLQTEDNALVLENILPGKYTDYLMQSAKPRTGLIVSVHNSGLKILKGYLPQYSKGSILPPLQNQPPSSTKSTDRAFDFSGSASTDRKETSFNLSDGSAASSSLTVPSSHPKVNLQTFKESLSLVTNPSQKSCLIFFTTKNKSFSLDFGFCEIVLNDLKNSSAHLSRYFIAKIYRKMKLIEVVTIKLINYLFTKFQFEKITIDFLVNNDSIVKELQNIGFKLQKVDRVLTKYKTYSLSKKDFYQLLNLTAPSPV